MDLFEVRRDADANAEAAAPEIRKIVDGGASK